MLRSDSPALALRLALTCTAAACAELGFPRRY